jgi:hypothetical protein
MSWLAAIGTALKVILEAIGLGRLLLERKDKSEAKIDLREEIAGETALEEEHRRREELARRAEVDGLPDDELDARLAPWVRDKKRPDVP